jgi:hypothetical protein
MQRVGGEPATDPGLFSGKASGIGREKDGRPKKRLGRGTKGHEGSTKGSCAYRLHTKKARATANGDVMEEQTHLPPVLANPGNVIQQTYTADEVAALLAEAGNVVHCNVGGGQMGSKIAHANEAPFPESLCEFFIRSFCPPGGVVLDCFSGSGTTAAVAVRWGRRALACDLRKSQVELTRRRVAGVTPDLFETTRAGDV